MVRLPHATAMVVGTIIGASIFVQQSEIAGSVPSGWGILGVWIAAGLLTLAGALVSAELASIFTRSGGVYVYLREAYSPCVGFLWGWSMFWIMHSAIIAAIAVVFARYFVRFLPGVAAAIGETVAIKVLAAGAIILLTAINCLGMKQGTWLQTLFTLGKLIAILVMIVCAFALGTPADSDAVTGNAQETETPAAENANTADANVAATPPSGVTFVGFMAALVAGLFAFGGWHMVAYNSEETVEPKKTIPRALVIGTLTVTACYVALNAAYLHILPISAVAASDTIAADAARVVVGDIGDKIMTGLVVFSTFGAVSGIILSGPRVYYAMAQDGLLFQWMGKIHPRTRTPVGALAAQGVWACVMACGLDYFALYGAVIRTEWVFFGMMGVALFIFRRHGLERDYSVWGYPIVPALFSIACFGIVIQHVLHNWRESMLSVGLVGAGIPVYFLWKRWSGKVRHDSPQAAAHDKPPDDIQPDQHNSHQPEDDKA